MTLPTDAAARKEIPIGTGVLDYFPDALAEVAKVSLAGNRQHKLGPPLRWVKDLSDDHSDGVIRHFIGRGGRDIDGERHSAKMAWRALALLQTEIELERRETKAEPQPGWIGGDFKLDTPEPGGVPRPLDWGTQTPEPLAGSVGAYVGVGDYPTKAVG